MNPRVGWVGGGGVGWAGNSLHRLVPLAHAEGATIWLVGAGIDDVLEGNDIRVIVRTRGLEPPTPYHPKFDTPRQTAQKSPPARGFGRKSPEAYVIVRTRYIALCIGPLGNLGSVTRRAECQSHLMGFSYSAVSSLSEQKPTQMDGYSILNLDPGATGPRRPGFGP